MKFTVTIKNHDSDAECVTVAELDRPGRVNAANNVFSFRIDVHDAELPLLMDGEFGMHETLIVGIRLGDITHVPLAYMGRVVAGVSQ